MWFDNVEGVKVTPQNAAKIAKWIGGNLEEVYDKDGERVVFIVATTNRGDVIIRVGDWVGRDKNTNTTRFRIMRLTEVELDSVFSETYDTATLRVSRKIPPKK